MQLSDLWRHQLPEGRQAVTEVLDYVPASFRVVRHLQPRFVCKGCDTEIKDEMPSLPIERGKPGPGLVAHVLIAKYCDHLPLYRQSEIYTREGVDIARSTMADWVGKANALLAPLIQALREHVFAANRLHADGEPGPPSVRGPQANPVPVLEPARDRQRPAASGPMFAMAAPMAMRRRRRSVTSTALIGKASVQGSI